MLYLQAKCNSELNDNLGNFVNRTIAFTKTKFGGVVPQMKLQQIDRDFIGTLFGIVDSLTEALFAHLASVSLDARNGLNDACAWHL